MNHLRSVLLRSDSKVSALNQKIDGVSRPSLGLLSLRHCIEALIECDFILEVLWSKKLLASNPKGLKN